MNEPTLEKIIAELSDHLSGQKFGKIFALSRLTFVIDFRLEDGKYLLMSMEPNSPRLYLIKRRLKTLEKQSAAQPSFVSFLRKKIANSVVEKIEKLKGERVVKIRLAARNELGQSRKYVLLIQLTGRSSNLFLLDENDIILETLRETSGNGQMIATTYSPPEAPGSNQFIQTVFPKGDFALLSFALDDHYERKKEDDQFRSRANASLGILNKELKKQLRLRKMLKQDLMQHGDPEKWKHFGDVLLANVATAKRNNGNIVAVDYFDPETPLIEIEAEENTSVTEAAENYFKLYTKARNAKTEIAKRLEILSRDIAKLEAKKLKLLSAIDEKDIAAIDLLTDAERPQQARQKSGRKDVSFTGARTFVSSDGFDILVGKRSKDNDFLTFRMAKSLDTWLHAADYPGSHVIIRNPNRQEIPQTTLIEAAQLAAFYSKARKEAKAAVHYTQKKFVNKPKGSAPGLVSLASFKTVLVEPKVPEQSNTDN
ncbi:MAG: NFACT family protein [Acidobacteria bacterium]|nr:NFACT family protein [Acidobacteriota bacterium]